MAIGERFTAQVLQRLAALVPRPRLHLGPRFASTNASRQPNPTLDSGSVPEPTGFLCQFPSPQATMKRHAGPILEKWAGQTLLAG